MNEDFIGCVLNHYDSVSASARSRLILQLKTDKGRDAVETIRFNYQRWCRRFVDETGLDPECSADEMDDILEIFSALKAYFHEELCDIAKLK